MMPQRKGSSHVGVILQAAYRRGPNESVPAPSDEPGSTIPWWYDHIASQAQSLRLSGFTAVLLPPVLKTSAGAAPDADGYGPFDDYDLGSKQQFFSVPTRFGTREQLQRCVAMLRANGLDVYVDTVPHQRMGGNNGVYRYLSADGKTSNGRFPKDPGCFVGDPPRVPRDPIAGPVSTDFGFGDEFAPVNAVPPGYVMQGLIDAGDWMTRALGVQGYRIDDVKGMAVSFVQQWLTNKAMASNFAVAEYFDGNPNTLNWWVWESGMNGRCNVFDFCLHFMLQAMCNNGSRWDMTQLDHGGLAGISPLQAVTFVENPDTDTDGYSSVIWNKMMGYAYILTSEGYPCVYYKDYSTDGDCYGLKPWIDNLIWIHENLAFGQTVQRWKDFQCFAFERLGYPNLLVGLNNDMWNGWRTITVQTAFGPNTQLHDYTGHAGDVWTDYNGVVTIGVPPNDNGMGYVCYSRTGYGQPFSLRPQMVTQVFEGADDLDIGPAQEGVTVQVGRCWCAGGTTVAVTWAPDTSRWTAGTQLVLQLTGPDGSVAASQTWAGLGPYPGTLQAQAHQDGWYTARSTGTNLPGNTPYRLTVQYTATQTL
jgi:alpha-amylase